MCACVCARVKCVCKNSFSICALIFFHIFQCGTTMKESTIYNQFNTILQYEIKVLQIKYCLCVEQTKKWKENGSDRDVIEGELPHPVDQEIIC